MGDTRTPYQKRRDAVDAKRQVETEDAASGASFEDAKRQFMLRSGIADLAASQGRNVNGTKIKIKAPSDGAPVGAEDGATVPATVA